MDKWFHIEDIGIDKEYPILFKVKTTLGAKQRIEAYISYKEALDLAIVLFEAAIPGLAKNKK